VEDFLTWEVTGSTNNIDNAMTRYLCNCDQSD